MNCSLQSVIGSISLAIGMLAGAIVLAVVFDSSAIALFGAAALVLGVTAAVIPALKDAIVNYSACRGPSRTCSISTTISTLGQVTSVLSVISFVVAGALQLSVLAFLSNYITAIAGLALSTIVKGLVDSGIAACVAGIGILLGVLSQVLSYKSCMDARH